MRLIQGMFTTRLTLRAAAVGAVAALLPLGLAVAQRAVSQRGEPEVTIIDAGGSGPDFDTRTVRRGFNLFGGGDAAFSGMRATGNFGTAITNYADCTTVLRNCQGNTVYSPLNAAWYAPWFEVEWALGAPPNEYLKIKQVAPSIANATGGGWTGGYNAQVLGRPRRFGPADGTLGKMFAGATSTSDGSCRDHSTRQNGFYGSGLQLLANSDCPETWGSDGWKGAHPIDLAGYKALIDAQGNNFAFDFWRVPAENQRLDKPFLGTRHHTYGETSDYSADVLPNYGSVVPGGTGTPVLGGYPLGLKFHFEAFNFGVPTVNDAYIVQVTIINRSEDLWGAPIDYDSLYLGFSIGTLFSSQNASRYAQPNRGIVTYHNSNSQGAGGPCDQSYRRPDGNGCVGATSTVRGYRAGAVAVMMLKSPLGDLRNKLFTRTAAGTPCTVGQDPFCRPGHPLAGDTITFNRQGFGDYANAYNYAWASGARAAFGYMAADENITNDGRDPASQPDRTLWTTFRSEDWTTNKVHYNKYVPPASPPWDYNHDGVPDTLALNTCGRLGCAVVDSDTMPGGWVNRRGNIGGIQSFGPFALGAGDTTSLIYAMVGDGDSTAFWAQINAVTDLYMNFFLAPDAPPPVRVVSTRLVAGTDQFGSTNPEVKIYFSDDPETWVDAYLSKTADDIQAATGGLYLTLRTNNPWLPDSLRTLARRNLQRLEIYRSCNGGSSWDADGDCDGDPARNSDGSSSGFGWRTYQILDVDANRGDVPNVFTDGNVDGGRTYMYTIVGRSRGATLLLDSIPGKPISYTFAPSISNSLSRSTSDPNVASVYVPAARPAGYRAATVDTTTLPPVTVPFALSLGDNVATQSYRAVFGSELLVDRDSNTVTHQAFRSIVTVRRRATVDVAGAGVDSIIRRESFTYAGQELFLVTGTAVTNLGTVVTGDTSRVSTLYGRTSPDTGLAFVLAEASGVPVFGSTTLTADKATPPQLFGRAAFPGFTLNADNSVKGNFGTTSESQFQGEESRAELRLFPADTIVPRGRVNANMVQWREASSTRAADGGGGYEVSWVDDPFGVQRGFVVDLLNPAATGAEVRASLEARAVGSTGVTDQATANLLAVAQTDLVAVKLPFTIRNTTFGRPVAIAMVRRLTNRLALGNLQDTISMEIPADVWVPGDALYFIEDVVEDSTVGGRLIMDSPTQPHQWTRQAITFSRAVLGCDQIRESCNPVPLATTGATGYLPMRNGDKTRFGYYTGFTPTTEYAFTVNAAVTGDQIAAVTDSALALIKVVPNPFVIFSAYQANVTNSRLLFSNVPSRGTMRIYTVAGQLVQQITWEPSDLLGDGDLFWDLKTREGIDIASGLYLWVLTAPSNPNNPASAPLRARGKFVVIRGDAQ